MTFALLFAVELSLRVELLFVAAVAVTFALGDIQTRAQESSRTVSDTVDRAYPLPKAWRAGVLLAHLGYWGVAAFLGGLLAAVVR